MSVKSLVTVDYLKGEVVWRMAPETAVFYAEELRRIQDSDVGIKGDADALNECASQLDDAGS